MHLRSPSITTLFQHHYLLGQLIKRDVLLRYRGAMFGVLWVFLHPLVMLGIFAFVFGQVFQSRWSQEQQGVPFWLALFSGLIAFNVFADAVSRAPAAVRGYPNYVKKVVFPVHILPLVPVGASLIHAAFNFMVLLGALSWTGNLHPSAALYPLVLAPLVLIALGMSWFLAAWGVFIKDMNQIVPPFVQMAMFLSPVFYPANAVPPPLRPLYLYNPLSSVIESCRAVALGKAIDLHGWVIAMLVGIAIAGFGFMFFQHSREEFADVL